MYNIYYVLWIILCYFLGSFYRKSSP